MANTILTAATIARASLGLLLRDIVLPGTVNRDAESDFSGQVGQTVNIRIPASFSSHVYTQTLRAAGTPITVDDITEGSIPVVLDQTIYVAAAASDEELTFSIVDFGKQVLDPQVAAVAIGMENILAAAMNAIAAGTITYSKATVKSGGSAIDAVLAARAELTAAKVPAGGRYLAVSPEVETALLQSPDLVRFDGSGDSPNQALREATVGRLFGFTVVSSPAITTKTAIAYHQDAFAFVTRAPIVPAGVVFGQSATYAGLGMRYIRDYDSLFLRDRSIVSSLAGAKLLDANRAVKITEVA